MSSRNRIPAAIEPLLQLPPETSLTILTGALGCNPSWMTSRFIGSLLGQHPTFGAGDDGSSCRILLVSWLHDLSFWKNEVRRTMGLDVSKAIGNSQLMFIDCIAGSATQKHDSTFSTVEKAVTDAIARISHPETKSDIFLILDSPDVLLATASATAQQLNFLLVKLRSLVHSVLLVCSADEPLLQSTVPSRGLQTTPLEAESSMFLTQQAHNARLLISLRELATGAAKDVSGVLRVTRSPGAYERNADAMGAELKETEALYLVSRDGSVKVFQRGTDAV